jgi:hypothetical protein
MIVRTIVAGVVLMLALVAIDCTRDAVSDGDQPVSGLAP